MNSPVFPSLDDIYCIYRLWKIYLSNQFYWSQFLKRQTAHRHVGQAFRDGDELRFSFCRGRDGILRDHRSWTILYDSSNPENDRTRHRRRQKSLRTLGANRKSLGAVKVRGTQFPGVYIKLRKIKVLGDGKKWVVGKEEKKNNFKEFYVHGSFKR